MRGEILGVDRRTGEGQIAGADGHRYTFLRDDWAHGSAPAIGLPVDFHAEGARALSLFPVPGATPAPLVRPQPPASDRNKVLAAVLAFFLGIFGVHRFYLGRTGSGIAMLLLTLTVVGGLVTGLWALVDTIRLLVMTQGEFERRYTR